MINAVYRDKPLMFIGATFREKLVSQHRAINEADSCLHMKHAGLKDVARTKESHFIGRLKTTDHWSARNRRLLSAEIGRQISGIVYEI